MGGQLLMEAYLHITITGFVCECVSSRITKVLSEVFNYATEQVVLILIMRFLFTPNTLKLLKLTSRCPQRRWAYKNGIKQ